MCGRCTERFFIVVTFEKRKEKNHSFILVGIQIFNKTLLLYSFLISFGRHHYYRRTEILFVDGAREKNINIQLDKTWHTDRPDERKTLNSIRE